MKKETWSGMLIATIFAVSAVVMAQSPAAAPATAPQSPSTSSSASTPSATAPSTSANSVTVTGCLREATPSATATSGSSTPSATDANTSATSQGKYELADAVPSSPSSSGASSSAPQTYRLIANDSALAPHVGKKLEFTGTVEKSASGEQQMHVEKASVLASDCTK